MASGWKYGIGRYDFVNGSTIRHYGSSRGGIRL